MGATMNVLLISSNREDINMLTLPMGLACVAAAVEKAGHAVRFLDLLFVKDIPAAVEDAIRLSQPEAIGVSVRNIDDQIIDKGRFLLDQAKEAVRLCRRFSAAPIILGGAGYSIFPMSALDYLGADMGIQGEGETAFPMLLERIESRKDLAGIPGLYLPGRGLQGPLEFIRDLDGVPCPEPPIFAVESQSQASAWLPFQTRRGCPLHCSYCSTASIEGHITRRRSPSTVVANLAEWVKSGFSQIFFVDNTFNLPSSYALELCWRITEAALKITWRCIFYPGEVSRELVEAMSKAGCREVSLGFESGSENILRGMNKHFGVEKIREASRLLAEFGIRRLGFLLLGGPGETRASVEESLSFADSLNLDALKLTLGIRIYPQTDLARQAVNEGLIALDDPLLLPRFYLVEELRPWLRETVARWAQDRPNWFF
jgi:radical SAM superfamily enzyme YgiQ (UPF0313 family)